MSDVPIPSAPASISRLTSVRIWSSSLGVGARSSKPITFSRIVVAPMKDLVGYFGSGSGVARQVHRELARPPNEQSTGSATIRAGVRGRQVAAAFAVLVAVNVYVRSPA